MSKLLVIDTETGGIDPSKYSILSLGSACWEDGEIVDTFEVFISEPEIFFDEEALKKNEIDVEWVRKNGLKPIAAVKSFHKFIENNFEGFNYGDKISIVGHNVSFDINFIRRLYNLAGFNFDEYFSHRTLDTAGIIRFLILVGKIPLSSAGLSEALKYFNIEIKSEERHTAKGDAIATAVLLNKLIKLVVA